MNLNEFGRLMKKRGANVPKNVNSLVQRVARRALRTIVTRSPFLSGQFRVNWLISLNQPDTRTVRIGRTTYSRSGAASEAIDSGNAKISRAKTGDNIIIQNNLPYANRLNQGWSAQAPAGFAEAALSEASSLVKSAKVVTND